MIRIGDEKLKAGLKDILESWGISCDEEVKETENYFDKINFLGNGPTTLQDFYIGRFYKCVISIAFSEPHKF